MVTNDKLYCRSLQTLGPVKLTLLQLATHKSLLAHTEEASLYVLSEELSVTLKFAFQKSSLLSITVKFGTTKVNALKFILVTFM